jgi:outer membrane lipoprotein-sorting protein
MNNAIKRTKTALQASEKADITVGRNRFRWGKYVAACVAAAVLLGVIVTDKNIVFADVKAKVMEIQSLRYTAEIEITGLPKRVLKGMILSDGRMRQESIGESGESELVQIMDISGGRIVTLMPGSKRAMVIELEDVQDVDKYAQNCEFMKIKSIIEKADEGTAESLGEKELGPVAVVGYKVAADKQELTVWADKETLEPVQIELVSKSLNKEMRMTMTNFAANIELDEELFSTKIPEGYTVTTINTNAAIPKEEEFVRMLKMWIDVTGGVFPSSVSPEEMKTVIKKEFEEPFEWQLKKNQEYQQKMKGSNSEEKLGHAFAAIMPVARGFMFVQQLPEESEWKYGGRGVMYGEKNVAIFRYKPADSETYRVVFGDLRVEEFGADELPEMEERADIISPAREEIVKAREEIVKKELDDLVLSLGEYAKMFEGRFPAELDGDKLIREFETRYLAEVNDEYNAGTEIKEARATIDKEISYDPFAWDRAFRFVRKLGAEHDKAYFGGTVRYGERKKALFWYKPEGFEKYRVILGDLTVIEAMADELEKYTIVEGKE